MFHWRQPTQPQGPVAFGPILARGSVRRPFSARGVFLVKERAIGSSALKIQDLNRNA